MNDNLNYLFYGDCLDVYDYIKNDLKGKVQCIYIDPPYGVGFNRDFKRKDGSIIKCYPDNWDSLEQYLQYMRERLIPLRELLTDAGSIFMQMGSENVHNIAVIMDEIFGAQNRVTTITYASTGGSSARTLPDVSNYLLWYAKDKERIKYRQPYQQLSRREIVEFFNWGAMVELENGQCRKPTEEERLDPEKYLPKNARLYKRTDLTSIGHSTTGRSDAYRWNGRDYLCPNRRQWSISKEGLDRLAEIGRLDATEQENSQLAWRRYEEEVPGKRLNNIWPTQMYAGDKRYVVQTANSTIERCILMTTDPGDLVLDPTCGSGTTAIVCEQWERKWIVSDQHYPAIEVVKERLLDALYDTYKFDINGDMIFKKIKKVSAGILAYDKKPEYITLYDRPVISKKNNRKTSKYQYISLKEEINDKS